MWWDATVKHVPGPDILASLQPVRTFRTSSRRPASGPHAPPIGRLAAAPLVGHGGQANAHRLARSRIGSGREADEPRGMRSEAAAGCEPVTRRATTPAVVEAGY